jgi:FkbM family methyltransferase
VCPHKKLKPEIVLNKIASIQKRIKNKIKKTKFNLLSKKLLSAKRYTTLDVEINGLKLRIPDAPSFLFSYKEIFNEEVYFFKSKKKNLYVIDAGANIGLSTIYFKKLYPNAEILAFEADPKIAEFFIQNMSSNGITDDITLIKKALHTDSGLYLSFSSEGADAGSLSKEKNRLTDIQVETVKLSDYINKTVDYLKIDIEGSEYNVIKDIEPKMHLIGRMFIEYHSFVGQEQNLHEILGILSKNNFRYYLDTPGLSSKNPFKQINTYLNMDLQINIFALKND